MALSEKLALLNLDEKETKKAKEKFLASLALISEDELNEKLDFLKSKDVAIKKANEIKVLTVPIEEMIKDFNILDEIHETDVYRYAPIALTYNVIDIYKRIKYCIQNNIGYKDDKGYKPFILKESLWRKEVLDKKIEEPSSMYEEDPVASLLDEKVEDTASVDLDELAKTTSFKELKESLENDIEDVNGYMADSKPAPEPEIEEFNTAPLEESREDAKEYMESLENVNDYTSNIKALLDDEVYNINIEPEEHDIDSYRRSM